MAKLLIFLALFSPLASFACPFCMNDDKEDPAKYMIEVDNPNQSNVGEANFALIPSQIYNLYLTEFSKAQRYTQLNLYWETPYFSAWAAAPMGEDKQHFTLNFWGGMARIPGMTKEGWAFTACHEVGHILGGLPRLSIKDHAWASSEGQADYFSAAQCLKRYFLSHDFVSEEFTPLSPFVLELCAKAHGENLRMRNVCEQIARAASSFARVLSFLSPEANMISIDTPSHSIVEFTIINSYPDPQCRIDTILSAGLCDKDPFSEDWICTENQGFRPSCWFSNL
ncbi:putative lipoprotein [Bacteriovorax sp. BSW11_IV]|uniref:hypothetical protein n=1 Tax=Bacteriovorax sp. BSW11_IV TaxID=1353529 RepID=UPI00038A557D|nr:hypothetical protein [Bacteriovorax sp. BSW11_IV]EQC49191.1 putative lipoprotein [Bacteriovorax sp. BSW11_IV]